MTSIAKLAGLSVLLAAHAAFAVDIKVEFEPAGWAGDVSFEKTKQAAVTEKSEEQLIAGGCLKLGTVSIRCNDDRDLGKVTLKEARRRGGDLVRLSTWDENRTYSEGYGKCLSSHWEVGNLTSTTDGGFAYPKLLICDKYESYRDVPVVIRNASGTVFLCAWDRDRADYRAVLEHQQGALREEIARRQEAEHEATAKAAEAETKARAEAEEAASAIRALTSVIERDPSNRKARMDRARLFEVTGNEQAALDDYAEIVKLNPDDADAWRGRIAIEARKERFDLLGPDLEQLLRLEPTNVDALNELAWLQQRTGSYADALLTCQRVLTLDPENDYAKNLVTVVKNDWRVLLQKLEASGDCERLVQQLTSLLELDQDCMPCYEKRGACYRKMGNTKLAEADEFSKVRVELKLLKAQLAEERRQLESLKANEPKH